MAQLLAGLEVPRQPGQDARLRQQQLHRDKRQPPLQVEPLTRCMVVFAYAASVRFPIYMQTAQTFSGFHRWVLLGIAAGI